MSIVWIIFGMQISYKENWKRLNYIKILLSLVPGDRSRSPGLWNHSSVGSPRSPMIARSPKNVSIFLLTIAGSIFSDPTSDHIETRL